MAKRYKDAVSELERLGIACSRDDPRLNRLLDLVKEREAIGYAYEAASAVLAYAFAEIGLTRVVAFISAQNRPSIGLARKLGLRYEREARLVGVDEDVCLYSVSHG